MKANQPQGKPESRPMMTQEQVATRLGLTRVVVSVDENNALRKFREEWIRRGYPVPGGRSVEAN